MAHDLIIRLTDQQWMEAQRAVEEELDTTLIRLGTAEVYYQWQDGEVRLIVNFEQRAPLGKAGASEKK